MVEVKFRVLVVLHTQVLPFVEELALVVAELFVELEEEAVM